MTVDLWLWALPHMDSDASFSQHPVVAGSCHLGESPLSSQGPRSGSEKAQILEPDHWGRLCDLRQLARPLWALPSGKSE